MNSLRLLLVLSLIHAAAHADFADEWTANEGQLILRGVPDIPADLVERLNRYQNVRSASFQDWSEDGESIYIATRFGDTRQLHHVAMPGGARRQLTFFKEPVGGAGRRPESAQLIFGMDEGGGEFYQLFMLDPENGESWRLTDGESRNGAATFSDDGKRLAFQSTRRNGRSNDVWMMEADDPESAKMIFESPDGSFWGPADFGPRGEKLLIENYVSITDSRIHLQDLESGETRLIAGGDEEPGVYVAEEFDTDGKGVFVVTDEGSRSVRFWICVRL